MSRALKAQSNVKQREDSETYIAMALNAKGGSGRIDGESEAFVACPLTGNPYGDHESREQLLITHALRADGFDASEDGTGRGTPLVSCMTSNGDVHSGFRDDNGLVAASLKANSGRNQIEQQYIPATMAVRRLTPLECERLQGFPDNYTLVPHRGKPAADGPRYKALGNSMAVPVIRWIMERMVKVYGR